MKTLTNTRLMTIAVGYILRVVVFIMATVTATVGSAYVLYLAWPPLALLVPFYMVYSARQGIIK